MKRYIIILIVLVLLVFSVGCKKDNANTNNTDKLPNNAGSGNQELSSGSVSDEAAGSSVVRDVEEADVMD